MKEMQEEVDAWIQSIGQGYFSELTNMSVLMEEVGEMARYISRMYGEQSFKVPQSKEDTQAALSDEMADVLWVLLCLANQTGVDLTAAFYANIEKKTERDRNRHAANPKLSDRKTE